MALGGSLSQDGVMHRIRPRLKPVWHETRTAERGRPVLVAETPHSLLIRLKGTRQVLQLPWAVVYLKACYAAAAIARLEKINARKSKRRSA